MAKSSVPAVADSAALANLILSLESGRDKVLQFAVAGLVTVDQYQASITGDLTDGQKEIVALFPHAETYVATAKALKAEFEGQSTSATHFKMRDKKYSDLLAVAIEHIKAGKTDVKAIVKIVTADLGEMSKEEYAEEKVVAAYKNLVKAAQAAEKLTKEVKGVPILELRAAIQGIIPE